METPQVKQTRIANFAICTRGLKLTLLAAACALSATVSFADEEPTVAAGFPGRIEAKISYDISNMIEGVITGVHFEPGQHVKVGEPLFTIDPTDFELAVETDQLNTVRAEAALKEAREEFERIKTLKNRGSATDVQVFKAEIAFAIGNAQLEQSEAELKVAKRNLTRTTVFSPIDGLVSASRVRPGSYVEVGDAPLTRVDQMDPVRLAFEVPFVERIEQLNLKDLRSPKDVLASIRWRVKISDTWTYDKEATPVSVSAGLDPSTGSITIWAELDNPNYVLRPGMTVTVIPARPND